ncbi:MAG: COX15/CtaA family protein [Hyphomicrobiales bacterium]|nr:COX15/CtaA family protein [Hyphomicrobiales bacterium]
MVVVGGATRLTESGLSITEWKPVTGVIPPLSDADWRESFEKYKQIPQYRELFPDMDLARYKVIYAWEWSHRLLGRLIGLVFGGGLLWFWMRGALSRDMKWKLSCVLALGALQGFVGWWMVASGLAKRVEVAQERLAIHLLLASVTFCALVWLASGLRERASRGAGSLGSQLAAFFLVALVLKQIFLGGLVAGLRAGLVYNTWPDMDGRFIPPFEHLFKLSPWWSNFFDNPTTVQFQHRMTAYLLVTLATIGALAWRKSVNEGTARALAAVALLQAALGVATLVLNVPLLIALAHQAVAMMVLLVAVLNARVARSG